VIVDVPVAADFPDDGFSHAAFETLLRDKDFINDLRANGYGVEFRDYDWSLNEAD